MTRPPDEGLPAFDMFEEFEELQRQEDARAHENPGTTWVMALDRKRLIINMTAVGHAESSDGGRTWEVRGPTTVYAGPERCENVWADPDMVEELRAGRVHPWLVRYARWVSLKPLRPR